MRIISIKFVFVFLVILSFSFDTFVQKTHIGLWKGTDQGQIGFLSLKENGYALFYLNNDSIGGEKFTENGIDAKMTYTIDYDSKPIKIDFIVARLDNNEELGRMLCIIEFIGESKMKIRLNFDNSPRPIDFLPIGNSDTIILEKEK